MELKNTFKNIPPELKSCNNWVARVDKLPINPHTLYGAKANNPSSWGTFEQATAAIGKRVNFSAVKGQTCNGIGFELSAPYCGIDIDHCINPKTGRISAEALDIIKIMNSYTEISPSGTGIHIFYKNDGNTHPEWSKKKPIDEVQHLEMYQCDRYFTLTGKVYGNYNTLAERAAEAKAVYSAYIGDKEKISAVPFQTQTAAAPTFQGLTDSEIIEKAMNAKNGNSFISLWRGDTGAYNNDESRADLALCNTLAFWSGGNADTIDRLFRQSGLMRDKWDRKTGGSTYGKITVEKALSSCREYYNPAQGLQAAMQDFKDSIRINKNADTTNCYGGLELKEFTYEDIKKYKANDIGTAKFFSELVKDFMCYAPEEKAFYIYNGTVWTKDDVKQDLITGKILMEFVTAAQKVIPARPAGNPKDWTPEEAEEEDINKAYREQYKYLGGTYKRNAILKDIKTFLRKSRNEFDRQPELLNCKNCTYNLETGTAQPHKASDFITKCVNANYDSGAHSALFEKFIDEICEGDNERKTALQTALGYSLIGATPEECFFIAYGKTTRNGKGTLFDLVLDTVGDYGLQMDFETIARSSTKDSSRATPDLARLIGVRYVLVNEPQKGTCFNEALVKQLTGSDDINARPLYGAIIQFKPLFTIFISTNNLPAVADDTLFTSDRIRILPFEKHFSREERDTHLKRKLREGNGRDAVLNWLIKGYEMYKQNGLTDTKAGNAILRQYRKENDYTQQFIDECLEVLDTNDIHTKKTRLTDIQQEYNYWCKTSNIKPLGKKLFREELEKHGINVFVSHKQYVAKVKIIDNRTVDVF